MQRLAKSWPWQLFKLARCNSDEDRRSVLESAAAAVRSQPCCVDAECTVPIVRFWASCGKSAAAARVCATLLRDIACFTPPTSFIIEEAHAADRALLSFGTRQKKASSAQALGPLNQHVGPPRLCNYEIQYMKHVIAWSLHCPPPTFGCIISRIAA